jgi:uncharacterized protein YcgL (UPF0745 family)
MGAAEKSEQNTLLRSLRAHKQVAESDCADVTLKPGETHVYLKQPGAPDQLIEKRKSFFKR